MQNIETRRLLLRPLVWDDLDDLFTLYGDPDLMKYITGRSRTYDETHQRLQAHIADHDIYGFGLCAAILKSSGEMIGRCGLEPVMKAGGLQGDIAWMFKREYWGRGLATEFGRAMIEVGFSTLSVQRIFTTADPANTASIKVMGKLGMTCIKSGPLEVEYELWNPDCDPRAD